MCIMLMQLVCNCKRAQKKLAFRLPSAALTFAKVMQTSAMKACFQIAECRFNFCKGRKNLGIMQVHFGSFVCFPYFLCYNSALCS